MHNRVALNPEDLNALVEKYNKLQGDEVDMLLIAVPARGGLVDVLSTLAPPHMHQLFQWLCDHADEMTETKTFVAASKPH